MKRLPILATLLFLPIALGQTPEARRPGKPTAGQQPGSILIVLDKTVPEVSFKQAPLEQVFDWLGDTMKVNVWVRWQALENYGIERDKPITIHARDVRLSNVLWMILTEAGGPDTQLAYGAVDNILVISTRDDLNDDMIVMVYDVRDLFERVPDFTGGPRMRFDSGGQIGAPAIEEGGPSDEGRRDRLEQEQEAFVEVITATVEPDSWVENGGRGTVRLWRGQLIVRNGLYVHQVLGGALRDMAAR
jgi:hypothetical protein